MSAKEAASKLKGSLRFKIFIVFLTILSIVLMFPKGKTLQSEINVGSVWLNDDLIADKDFPVYKDEQVYQRERRKAAEDVYPIFLKDTDLPKKKINQMEAFNEKLISLIDTSIKIEQEVYNNTFLNDESFQSFLELRRKEKSISYQSDLTLKVCFDLSKRLLQNIYKKGILDREFEQISADSISVRQGKYEQVFPKTKYHINSTAADYINNRIRDNLDASVEIKIALAEYTKHFLQPNIVFNSVLTDLAKKTAMDLVSPNSDIVKANELIIAKHERITEAAKSKIESYNKSRTEQTGFWEIYTHNFGKFVHIVIILSIFSIYIFLFRKWIYHDNFKILLLAIIILFVCAIAFLIQQIDVEAPIEYLILVPVASMLLTIMFDSRIGFYGTVVVALICGALRGNDYIFSVTNIIAGAMAAYTVRDIKNRNQIFRSFLFISLGYILSIVAFGLERFEEIEDMLIQSSFAVSNALISPIFTYGLIIFFEKLFNMTTDLTYLELTDFNHPLLKDLSKKAPGTFTHSMTMGSLVESAAEDINANPILARVGAYYHDIGKTLEPDYFVENQMTNENLHEKITPKRSAELIINHVNKGIELAKKHNLPQDIIDFIPMHHGTMVIQYFYEKAKEELGEENVKKEEFRYPGPKPKTKETALVMLADACESTIRSMDDPTPQKVENVINNLINIRVSDGQLDECLLTFKDISTIKSSFLSILLSQHHKRIRYPKQDEMENETADDSGSSKKD